MIARKCKPVWLLLVGLGAVGCSQPSPENAPTPISYAPSSAPPAASQENGSRAAKMMNEAKQKAKP